jgi:hypothetical protein
LLGPRSTSEDPYRLPGMRQDGADHRQPARRVAIARRDRNLDRIDSPPALDQPVEDRVRQGRRRAGPGKRDNPCRTSRIVERRKPGDEIARIGEIDIMHPRGDRSARQLLLGALERPGRVDNDKGAAGSQLLGSHRPRIEAPGAHPRRERRCHSLRPVQVASGDDKIKIGRLVQPGDQPAAKGACPADHQHGARGGVTRLPTLGFAHAARLGKIAQPDETRSAAIIRYRNLHSTGIRETSLKGTKIGSSAH